MSLAFFFLLYYNNKCGDVFISFASCKIAADNDQFFLQQPLSQLHLYFYIQVSCDITFLSPSNGICSVSMWWTSGWHFGRGLLLGTEIYKRLQGTFAASGGWELHRYTDRTHYATLPCYLQARYVDELEGNMMVIHIKLLNDNLKSKSC